MCILFMYLNDEPDRCPYKLIVASNRDEYWDKPTDKVAFRGEKQQWIGAIDLTPGREGGTWLGLSKTGKFAVLLNILTKQRPATKGRGHWVSEFVQSDVSCEKYIQTVYAGMDECNAFQFICTDLSENPGSIHFISNAGNSRHTPRKLSAGVHSCCNSSDFDTPWKKRVVGQKLFSNIVHECRSWTDEEKLVSSLMDLLSDRTEHGPDPQLSKQFEEYSNPVDTEFMKKGSAVYVWSAHNKCVTRTNTVILVDFAGNCDYHVRELDTPVDLDNPQYSSASFKFKLESVSAE